MSTPLTTVPKDDGEPLFSAGAFAGGSELAARMRALDWSRTTLGPPQSWPQSLKTTVALLLQSPVPMVLLWGPDGIMLYNDAYSGFAGSRHPSLLGAKVLEGWHEVADFNRRVMEVGLSGGTLAFQDQHLVLNRHGRPEEVWLDLFYSPVPDESGAPGGVLAVVVETTRRVLSERRLAALRGIAARTADAKTADEAAALSCTACEDHRHDIPFALLYLLDGGGRSARLVGRFGIGLGDGLAPPVATEDGAGRQWPWQDAIANRRTVVWRAEEVPLSDPDREPVTEGAVVPLAEAEQDKPTGFVVFGANPRLLFDNDYRQFFELATASMARSVAHARAYEEERRRAESLAELDRAKTAFFSNVSHEFRTPLTLMLSPLEEVLGGKDRASPAVYELVEVAHRNALRLQRLVNTLLDFSRIEAGRTQAHYEATDLSALTADLASSFRSAMENAGLTFTISCPPLPQPVYVDRDMWEKIVLNLVSNAFKYTLRGGVTVRLEARDGQAVLSVQDTGTGIPEAELPRVFDRFHRVEGTRGRTQEGTGIGLALVAELVKLHRGEIDIASAAGHGSTFTVSLPFGTAHLPREARSGPRVRTSTAAAAKPFLDEASRWVPDRAPIASASTAPAAELDLGPAARPRVLVAEDNADMRQYVTRLLSPECNVEAVSNGAEALARAESAAPDLVLTDVMMPEMDGFALLTALRSNQATQMIPVILLSARAGEEARSEGMDAGADDYIVKPFSARELTARVRAHLKLAQARKEAEQAVRKSEERFRAFVTATSDVVYRVNADWTATDQIRGRNFIADTEGPNRDWLRKYIPEEDHEMVLAAIAKAIAAKAPLELEHRVIRVDGTLGWTFSRAIPMMDEQGNIVEWFGAARDITARKRAEQELERFNTELQRTNRELEEFAYVASHDLKEPLRMVSIYTQLLLRRVISNDESAKEFAGFIDRGVTRMQDLVRDLLEFSRTIQAQGAPEAGTADLSAVLREAMNVLQGRIEEAGAVVIADPLPAVRADAGQLAHVFQNIVENALKYRRADRRCEIRITAKPHGPEWIVSVEDNGIGFEQEYAERIFGLFKRLHRDEYPGTGLGLAICRRIVERYGGRIWAEGRPGNGATFFVSLLVVE